MKPLWPPTLAWIVAIAIALLLAFAGPDAAERVLLDDFMPQGASTPR